MTSPTEWAYPGEDLSNIVWLVPETHPTHPETHPTHPETHPTHPETHPTHPETHPQCTLRVGLVDAVGGAIAPNRLLSSRILPALWASAIASFVLVGGVIWVAIWGVTIARIVSALR